MAGQHIEVSDVHVELLKVPIQWKEEYIITPIKPGFGLKLDEQVAAAHPYEGPIFVEVEISPIYQHRLSGKKQIGTAAGTPRYIMYYILWVF